MPYSSFIGGADPPPPFISQLFLIIMKKFAITAEGFELPDYVHAETENEALLTWASTIVGVRITEIEQVGDPITEIEQD